MFIRDIRHLIKWAIENEIPFDTPMNSEFECVVEAGKGMRIKTHNNFQMHGLNLHHCSYEQKQNEEIDGFRTRWSNHIDRPLSE